MTVTGRDIIEELVERMRTESEPLRYSALAHGVYRVFLHREDYDRLSPARRSLVEEASRALDEELDRLNADRTPAPDNWGKIVQAATRLMKPVEPPLRRPPAGWVIELYPDEDEELHPGHIRVTSELGQPPAQAILAGEPTQRVQPLGSPAPPAQPQPPAPTAASAPPSPAQSSVHSSVQSSPVQSPAPSQPAVHAAPMPPVPAPDATRRTTAAVDGSSPTARVSTAAAWGELTYRDSTGQEHNAPLVGDLVRIGRGGRGAQVDVTVQGPDDISRTHLQLRREASGGISAKDVSRFGTTMDNVRIPPSLDGTGRDLEQWVPVGARAQFGLAGVIVLHFKRVGT